MNRKFKIDWSSYKEIFDILYDINKNIGKGSHKKLAPSLHNAIQNRNPDLHGGLLDLSIGMLTKF